MEEFYSVSRSTQLEDRAEIGTESWLEKDLGKFEMSYVDYIIQTFLREQKTKDTDKGFRVSGTINKYAKSYSARNTYVERDVAALVHIPRHLKALELFISARLPRIVILQLAARSVGRPARVSRLLCFCHPHERRMHNELPAGRTYARKAGGKK